MAMRRSAGCLCVLLALLLGAIGAPSAFGEEAPEFFTVGAIGVSNTTVPFRGSGVSPIVLEGKTSKAKVICTSWEVVGEATAPKLLQHGLFVFHGCETAGVPCETEGQLSGEIVTSVLEGELGNVTPLIPGVRFFSEFEGHEGVFARYSCGAGLLEDETTGSVIGRIFPATGATIASASLPATLQLKFAAVGAGLARHQQWRKFLPAYGPEEEQLSSLLNEEVEELTNFAATFKPLTTTPGGKLGVTN